jgi:Transglutaminase elicitor
MTTKQITKNIFAPVMSLCFLTISCGQSNHSTTKEAWDERNNPVEMSLGNEDYIMDFAKLPLSGRLTTHPWSADYWPTYRGGISQRWNKQSGDEGDYVTLKDRAGYPILTRELVAAMTLAQKQELSPAEKFDIFTGNYDFRLTRQERRRTRVMRTIPDSPEYDENFEIPGWEGLCHGWAPGAINFAEPHSAVLLNADNIEVPFGSADVKGLLTYVEHAVPSKTNFLAGRCELDFTGYRYREPVYTEYQETVDRLHTELSNRTITRAEYDTKMAEARKTYDNRLAEIDTWIKNERNSDDCRDTNAGSFHVVITNQIGLRNEGFVADVTRDYQVWNQPISGFTSEIVASFDGAPAIAASLGDDYLKQAATGTVRVVQVKTLMNYVVETGSTYEPQIFAEGEDENIAEYSYYLELDVNGRIIGGKWQDDDASNNDRPDFLWKKDKPSLNGYFAPIAKIYEAATAPLPPR